MKIRTEDEIISGWQGRGPALVTVCCTTYNHEIYVREAIESFLIQETEFPFEIIIHDDASTDGTAAI
ncbi:MAG: glycosyltransferase, partial [Gammaproteobacteria bacterium]